MPAKKTPPDATVLFDAREASQYRDWRRGRLCEAKDNSSTLDEITPVPNAFEYTEYLAHRRESGHSEPPHEPRPTASPQTVPPSEKTHTEEKILDARPLPIAETCKHPLHPAHAKQTVPGSWIEDGEGPDTPSYCPVCTLQAHQTLVAALADNWTQLGAPWRTKELQNDTRSKYSSTNRAHARARADLLNAVRGCEDAVEKEEDWEKANPEKSVEHVKPSCAASALEQYKQLENMMFPAETEGHDHVTPAPKRRSDTHRHITYSPDTPQDTAHRPQSDWHRGPRQAAHRPHACPSAEGWCDTSYMNDWHYAVSQCRILLLRFNAFTQEVEYSDLNAGSDRGQENPHVATLIAVLEAFMATLDEEMQMRWMRYLACTGDVFLVWGSGEMGAEGAFDLFERAEALMGSEVEAYARQIGDIDDEEWAARQEELRGRRLRARLKRERVRRRIQ